MPLYEIINPSDYYTVECPDTEIAFVVCCLLGNGNYPFDPIDGSDVPKVPLFLFGGADEWCQEKLGASADDVLARCLDSRRSEVATAMDSVLIGKRAAFLAIAPPLGTPEFYEARAKWHDANRSSLNDIGGRAYKYAESLRKPRAEQSPATSSGRR